MKLNNFTLIAADDPNEAIGYRWDATDISVPLGDLAAGESSTLTYVTIVHSDSFSPGQPSQAINLIAYSGFGDPIGKQGGRD